MKKRLLIVLLAFFVGPGCTGSLKIGGLAYDVESVPPGIASVDVNVEDTTVKWMFDPWLGIEKLVKGVTGLIPMVDTP